MRLSIIYTIDAIWSSHQKQALSFMLRREMVLSAEDYHDSIWKAVLDETNGTKM